MITVLGILGGAALGTRYKVLCLVPASAIGIAAVAAYGVVNEVPVGATVQTALALALGLQMGYLTGVSFRSVFPGALARRLVGPERLREQPARTF